MTLASSNSINWKQTPKGEDATAWRAVEHGASIHIQTPGRITLCRIGDGNIYLWDKGERKEVAISIYTLIDMLI